MMKVRYEGITEELSLTHGKIYDVMEVNPHGFYRIMQDDGDDYLIPKHLFAVVQE